MLADVVLVDSVSVRRKMFFLLDICGVVNVVDAQTFTSLSVFSSGNDMLAFALGLLNDPATPWKLQQGDKYIEQCSCGKYVLVDDTPCDKCLDEFMQQLHSDEEV